MARLLCVFAALAFLASSAFAFRPPVIDINCMNTRCKGKPWRPICANDRRPGDDRGTIYPNFCVWKYCTAFNPKTTLPPLRVSAKQLRACNAVWSKPQRWNKQVLEPFFNDACDCPLDDGPKCKASRAGPCTKCDRAGNTCLACAPFFRPQGDDCQLCTAGCLSCPRAANKCKQCDTAAGWTPNPREPGLCMKGRPAPKCVVDSANGPCLRCDTRKDTCTKCAPFFRVTGGPDCQLCTGGCLTCDAGKYKCTLCAPGWKLDRRNPGRCVRV